MNRPAAGRRGFTLLEILIALAIFSVIAVLLLSAFTGAERARDLLSARARDFRQIRMTIDRLGTDLEGAVASNMSPSTALAYHEDTFSGMPAATLVFTAFVLPESGGPRPPSDIVKIRYFPQLSPDGRFLELYREEASLPLIENKIPLRQVRLATRLKGFRAEFYDGTTWTKEWPPAGRTSTALPADVAFILTSSSGQEYRRVVPLPLAGQEAQLLYSGRRAGSKK